MVWCKLEINVSKTTDKGDPELFNVKILGKPPTTEYNLTLDEVIKIIKEIYIPINAQCFIYRNTVVFELHDKTV